MKRTILILLITLTANCAANDYYFQLVHKYNFEYYLSHSIIWFYNKSTKNKVVAKRLFMDENVVYDSANNENLSSSKFLELDTNIINEYKKNNLCIYIQSFLTDEKGEHYEFLDTLDIPYEAKDTIIIESEIPDK